MLAQSECQLCGSAFGGPHSACDICASLAAAFVLNQPSRVVAMFWDVDVTFADRRDHFRSLAGVRRRQGGGVYGGLAVGYLAMGLKTDATLVAAMGVLDDELQRAACCDPVGVLFDPRVLHVSRVSELARAIQQARVERGR